MTCPVYANTVAYNGHITYRNNTTIIIWFECISKCYWYERSCNTDNFPAKLLYLHSRYQNANGTLGIYSIVGFYKGVYYSSSPNNVPPYSIYVTDRKGPNRLRTFQQSCSIYTLDIKRPMVHWVYIYTLSLASIKGFLNPPPLIMYPPA